MGTLTPFEGSITANGTVQTIFDVTGTKYYAFQIDLSNMADGDLVTVTVYLKDAQFGTYVKYVANEYDGVQDEALYYLAFLPAYGIKVTIQQTTGTYKSFDWVRWEDS